MTALTDAVQEALLQRLDAMDVSNQCPSGCGCRRQTEDPDQRDCACDGPCCVDPDWWDGQNLADVALGVVIDAIQTMPPDRVFGLNHRVGTQELLDKQEVLALLGAQHTEPHLVAGLCQCDCPNCTDRPPFFSFVARCICPSCNASTCRLHEATP